VSKIEFVKRHPWVTVVSVVIVLPLLVFALWATITLNVTYASGERAGFLQKLSKKGWLCKTWEGELQLVNIPGAAPEKFYFTVRSDSLADVMNTMAGKQIVLSYKQHRGVPTSCFGDTEYFVHSARFVNAP
jgi:hypothetical protein